MTNRTISQINEKIENGEANIYTAEEFKKLIKNDEAPSYDDVDVVTCGTCGVMSGTAAILNFIISEPGEFIRANEVYLNGVPAYAGPCPNEWLGSVDVILHGTAHSIDDENYGGGFLLKDLLEGKSIDELTNILEKYKTLHNTTDVDTAKRAIRAIEIQEYYHNNPHLEEKTEPHPVKNAVVIGVDIDRENRRNRISARLKSRLENGMVEEVRSLIDSGVKPVDLIYYGLEYKFLTKYVIGELNYNEMVSQLEIAIHQFSKRQMTWFRGMERRGFHIHWVPYNLSDDEFIEEVISYSKSI